jgi:uncharacterized membrane-anchored protein YhcB (DUF1043 family)
MIWWILIIGLIVALIAGWMVDRNLRRRGESHHDVQGHDPRDDNPRRFGSPGGV